MSDFLIELKKELVIDRKELFNEIRAENKTISECRRAEFYETSVRIKDDYAKNEGNEITGRGENCS